MQIPNALKEMLVSLVHAKIHEQVMALDWIPDSMRDEIHNGIIDYLRKKAGLPPLTE